MQQAILSNFLLHTNNFCLFFKYINFYLNGDWLNEDFVSISKWFINKRKQKKLRKSKQVTKLNISDKGAQIKESSILIYLGCIFLVFCRSLIQTIKRIIFKLGFIYENVWFEKKLWFNQILIHFNLHSTLISPWKWKHFQKPIRNDR